MSTGAGPGGPPTTQTQYSADGRWWWNGSTWQPVPMAQAAPPRGGFPIWGWFAIGCGALLLLSIAAFVALAVVGFSVASRAQCPPDDFPTPVGAHQMNQNVFAGTGGSTCDVSWNVTMTSDDATSFYRDSLNQGDWELTGQNSAIGNLAFQRRSNPGVKGTVLVLSHGQESDIQVHFTSDRPSFGR